MVKNPLKNAKMGKKPQNRSMSFWDNVLAELEYLGMTNKSLAEKAGFDASNIGRGIRLKSSPSVETAVKIAKILNVSVEYLVTGKEDEHPKDFENINCPLYHKYSKLLNNLEKITEKERKAVFLLVEKLAN